MPTSDPPHEPGGVPIAALTEATSPLPVSAEVVGREV